MSTKIKNEDLVLIEQAVKASTAPPEIAAAFNEFNNSRSSRRRRLALSRIKLAH